jgi:Flp pilus assembly protein TadG
MKQRGQATVELVLMMPLLLALLFLLFEFGRVFGSWIIITNSSREGARYAVVLAQNSTSNPAIQGRVQATAQFLDVDAVPCTGSYSSCIQINRTPSTCVECTVTVTVRYRVFTLMPITGDIPFLGPINYPGFMEVVGVSTMRAE